MKKKASPTPKKNSPAKKKVAKPSVKEKPIILITNDDGITAPGIRNLVEAVKDSLCVSINWKFLMEWNPMPAQVPR